MAVEAKTLSKNGKRAYTRGWTGSRWVKRATSKKARRNAREAIRDNDGDILKPATKGWVW